MLKSSLTLAVMMLAFAGMSAAADEPYAGSWKLNVAQSKYQPGPSPQSETVTITPGGESDVKGMDAQGNAYSWSFTPSEGVAVPITGMGPDSTVIERRSSTRTVDQSGRWARHIRWGMLFFRKTANHSRTRKRERIRKVSPFTT